MKKLSTMMVVVAFALLGVFTSNAKDLFWEGTNGTWKIGNGGWKLEDGTPATFENGDNVTFGTSGTAEDVVSVRIGGTFNVGNIVFDHENRYELGATSETMNILNGLEGTKWIKRGTGTLALVASVPTDIKIKSYTSYTRDIEIEEGEISVETKGAYALGNPYDNRKIIVHEGTRLDFKTNTLVANQSKNNVSVDIIVSNGVFKIVKGCGIGSTTLIGNGILDWTTSTGSDQTLVFGPKFTVDRNEPFIFENKNPGKQINFILDPQREGKTEFCVNSAKVNALNNPDLAFNVCLRDKGTNVTGVIKTGDGIMMYDGNGSCGRYSYTGETQVLAGGFYHTSTYKGRPNKDEPRLEYLNSNVVVKSGATFGANNVDVKGNLELEEGSGFLVDATKPTASFIVAGDCTLPQNGILMVFNYTNTLAEAKDILKGIPLPIIEGVSSGFDTVDFKSWHVVLKGYDARTCRKELKIRKESDNTLTIYHEPTRGFRVIVK